MKTSNVSPQEACRAVYGSKDMSSMFGAFSNMSNQDVVRKILDEKDPFGLSYATFGKEGPNSDSRFEVDASMLHLAKLCLGKKYTNDDMLQKIEKLFNEQLRRSETMTTSVRMHCPRTVDPIDILSSNCSTLENCMVVKKKGDQFFWPNEVMSELSSLKKSINDDLNEVNRLLKDEGKGRTLAQDNPFRGAEARREQLKRQFSNITNEQITKHFKNKHGARGSKINLQDKVKQKDRMKKQRRKKIRALFKEIQKGSKNGSLQDSMKQYFTLTKVLNVNTKSAKIDRTPGGNAQYYRPPKKRKTTPELRLKQKALNSIIRRFEKDNPAPGTAAFKIKEKVKDFAKIDRPLRLQGADITKGGNRKDYERLKLLGIQERLVPSLDSKLTFRKSDRKGKGSQLYLEDIHGQNAQVKQKYESLVQIIYKGLEDSDSFSVKVKDLMDNTRLNSADFPLLSSGDYIRLAPKSFIVLSIDPSQQRMVFGPESGKILGIESTRFHETFEYHELSKIISDSIHTKFINAVFKSFQEGKPVELNRAIATDKEIYIPGAITMIKGQQNITHIGIIKRTKNKFHVTFVDIARLLPRLEVLNDLALGVYFILREIDPSMSILSQKQATAKLRRYIREKIRNSGPKAMSQDYMMWYTKSEANVKEATLSPISPILNYVRAKKHGEPKVTSSKYYKSFGRGRENERIRRLPLRRVVSAQPVGDIQAVMGLPIDRALNNVPMVQTQPALGYALPL